MFELPMDVLIHKVGVRVAKIRLAKLKEPENDAVVRVYSGYFLCPFDDESPQDKTTHEEEEKEEVKLDESLNNSSGQVVVWGEGCTKSWRVVISMSSSWRHPFLTYTGKHNKLRIPNIYILH